MVKVSIWECSMCGYIYNEDLKEIPFEELPDTWLCPECKAPKKYFNKIE